MNKSHVRRQGRPRKIKFSDLFLWHPRHEMELMGKSIPELADFITSNDPADSKFLTRIFYDAFKKDRKISEKRCGDVIDLLKEYLTKKDISPDLLDGIEEKGPWNAFFANMSTISPRFLHILEIEKELEAPTLAFQRKEMQACCDMLKRNCPKVSKHLDEDVFNILQSIQHPDEFWPYRVMVMLDIQLSLLAYTGSIMPTDIDLRDFFPDFDADPFVHPNARFFSWLANQAGGKQKLVSHIQQIDKPEKDRDEDSVEKSYRRWKSGEVMPSYDSLDALFGKLYDSDEQKIKIACEIYYAIKRLDLFFITPFEKAKKEKGYVCMFVHSGYDSIQGWVKGRYDYWLQYWRDYLKR